MDKIRTVLGDIAPEQLGVVLPHEHIFCYSDYLYEMAGAAYLDKEALFPQALKQLVYMKQTHGLGTFVDCTPINIGRDIPYLRRLSAEAGVHIICSSGFYYTQEPLLRKPSAQELCDFLVMDAQRIHAGILKCAVEEPTELLEKLFRATALAHLKLGLPIVAHTNAKNESGRWALDILLGEGVSPKAITVSHLSDTEDVDYLLDIAARGCYLGLDRHYAKKPAGYEEEKIAIIQRLWDAGYGQQLLLSHDALFYSGFSSEMNTINPEPRYPYLFERILPAFPADMVWVLTVDNPRNKLLCR